MSSKRAFLRSDCVGGSLCQAGCEIHKTRLRNSRSAPSRSLTKEISFESSESHINKEFNSFSRNGRSNLRSFSDNEEQIEEKTEDEDDVDEVILRRVKNIICTRVYRTYKQANNLSANARPRNVFFIFLPIFLFIIWYLYHLKPIIRDENVLPLSLVPISHSHAKDDENIKSLNKKIDEIRRQMHQEFKMKFDEMHNKIKEDFQSRIEEEINKSRNCCSQLVSMHQEVNSVLKSIIVRVGKVEVISESLKNDAGKNGELFLQLKNMQSSIKNDLIALKDRKDYQNNNNIAISQVNDLIKEALLLYDADKTGIADYALESAGGTVISSRCSETYNPYVMQYSVFGIPFWLTSNSPRTVIQPSISPGECWAFKGTQGRLLIRLATKIIPTAFTYEHIPKTISIQENIDSAPYSFSVKGMTTDQDTEGYLLGNYYYEDNDQPIQRFTVQSDEPRAFTYLELIVNSNHGNREYTCLYRFRVHGRRYK